MPLLKFEWVEGRGRQAQGLAIRARYEPGATLYPLEIQQGLKDEPELSISGVGVASAAKKHQLFAPKGAPTVQTGALAHLTDNLG
jgi:hypothetical protein